MEMGSFGGIWYQRCSAVFKASQNSMCVCGQQRSFSMSFIENFTIKVSSEYSTVFSFPLFVVHHLYFIRWLGGSMRFSGSTVVGILGSNQRRAVVEGKKWAGVLSKARAVIEINGFSRGEVL